MQSTCLISFRANLAIPSFFKKGCGKNTLAQLNNHFTIKNKEHDHG